MTGRKPGRLLSIEKPHKPLDFVTPTLNFELMEVGIDLPE